jgi:hypothetical protein
VSLGRLLLVDGVRLGANRAMSSGCLCEMSKLCSSELIRDCKNGGTDLGAIDRRSHFISRTAVRSEFDHVIIHAPEVSSSFS